ncbi:MAG TPA: Rrf2 family transcriptional regulator [Candidatus Limnocylindrales bacterium]
MRLDITRKSDLAIRAIRVLAEERSVWKGLDLSSVVGTTPAFLNQVLGPLVRAGWIQSAVGPTGGYRYVGTVAPSVLAVIEAVEGPTLTGTCVLERGTPCFSIAGGERCALHDAWTRAAEALLAVLDETPVLAVAEEGIAEPVG